MEYTRVKIVLSIILLFVYSYAQSIPYNITYKNGTQEEVDVVTLNKDAIEVSKYGNKQLISLSDIDTMQRSFKENSFIKVILLKNGNCSAGNVIYINGGKVSLEYENKLEVFNLSDVNDIISYEDFIEGVGKSAYGALGRSLLFPGLGQMYTYGRSGTGLLFSSSCILALSGGIYSYKLSKQYEERYKDSKYSANTNFYDMYRTYNIASISFFSVALAIYAWSAQDAYSGFIGEYSANEKCVECSKSRKVTLDAVISSTEVQVRVTAPF
jgi:hypothetical protein